MKPDTIASVTPTLAALMGVPAPALSEAPPMMALLAAAAEAGIDSIDRCFIYCPDAIGTAVVRDNPEPFGEVREAAPVEINLQSVYPPKTPVCFATMFTGASPEAHGIRRYVRRVLECDTVFDALIRGGRRPAIATVKDSSMEILFKGRRIEIFAEAGDDEVTARSLELIAGDRHDLIIAYHQEYDDTLHEKDPGSEEALAAIRRHAAAFAALAGASVKAWAGRDSMVVFAPDHGAHLDLLTGTGDHGEDIPEDMEVTHFAGLAPAAGRRTL